MQVYTSIYKYIQVYYIQVYTSIYKYIQVMYIEANGAKLM